MSELSHIVRKNDGDYRIVDIEARAKISQLQSQIGNIDLSDLDLELPKDPEFNTVTIGETTLTENDLFSIIDFISMITPIEGVYF